jgi:prenyltransferase beta subunit
MNVKKTIFNIIFVLSLLLTINFGVNSVSASNLTAAIDWLKNNQNADGHFGTDTWNEHWTAYAALALYSNDSNSTNTTSALSWLKPRLEDPSYWFWSITGEVDIPALILYTFASTSHLSDISGNLTNISSNLLYYKNNFYVTKGYSQDQNFTVLSNNGGFSGLEINFTSDYNFSRVEDSVDTSFALLGLISSDSISESNKTAAINYLLSLQNPDGSFNLTSDSASSGLYSLGPDLGSTTALSLIALNTAGYNSSEKFVTDGLNYLKNSSITCLENKNYSYAAALSAWALGIFGEDEHANSLINYLMILQNNSDGGFSDSRRSTYPMPQPLDTAIAAIAMEKINATSNPFNASMTANSTIVVGNMQKISVDISGAILCTHSNYLTANITFPNGTIKQTALVFNPSSDTYEGFFTETTTSGAYNITVVVDPIFYDSIVLNFSFDVKIADGNSCNQSSECLNNYCVHNICRLYSTYCSDGYCDSGESCSSCSNDCGQCQTSSPSSSDRSSNLTTSTTSTATTSTTTTIKTTSTTTSITIPVTTTTTKTTTTAQSTPLTGMFSIISTYRWQLVLFIATIAFIIFLLRREGIIP